MLEILTDPTFLKICAGTSLIGATSGALGCFAYLRRQALIGDVVSHASLLGIVAAFVISALVTGTGSKSFTILVPGALVAGLGSLLLTRLVVQRTRIKEDAALGVMLALFFGGGIFLLRIVQRAPSIKGHAGLEDYVFGLAAAITYSDLLLIVILSVVSIGTMLLLWAALKVHTFDRAFAHTLGLPSNRLDTVMLGLLVMGIVIGIHAVGVVLMIALLVTPASAARQWTSTLGRMVTLAAVFGALAGAAGSLASAFIRGAPTGPVIVLAATAIFVISVLFAPRRGVWSRYRARKRAARESALSRGAA